MNWKQFCEQANDILQHGDFVTHGDLKPWAQTIASTFLGRHGLELMNQSMMVGGLGRPRSLTTFGGFLALT